MLVAQPQDRDYLNDVQNDVEAVIDELSINVQDTHWLVYCALGGHEHYDLPVSDQYSRLCMPDFYTQAA